VKTPQKSLLVEEAETMPTESVCLKWKSTTMFNRAKIRNNNREIRISK